jgi:predicted transcriptional regulator of viral defense system
MRGLEQTGALDARIAELAEWQHGVAGRRQLEELGLGGNAIDRRLRLGRLHRVHRGVYAVGHRVLSREGRWMAAVLVYGSDAVLSHRSAAELWGIRDHSSRAIEVTAHSKSRSQGTIQRHFAVLPKDEVTIRNGIPVTIVPRTLFDLAAVVPTPQVEHALRQSERLRLYDALSLDDLLARYPRRHGSRAIRECLRRLRDLPAGVTREELEARFVAFLDRSGFPRPQLNAWIDLKIRRYRADCLWPGPKVIVELDGYATHGTRAAFEDDRERDRRLAVAGYRVMHVTWLQLHATPEDIAADLRLMLATS